MEDDRNVSNAAGATKGGEMITDSGGRSVCNLRKVAKRIVSDDGGKTLTNRSKILGPHGKVFSTFGGAANRDGNTGESALIGISVGARHSPRCNLRKAKKIVGAYERGEISWEELSEKSACG